MVVKSTMSPMAARLRTQRLASPGFRGEIRGREWAHDAASLEELENLRDFCRCTIPDEEREDCFVNYNGVSGLGATLFVFTIRPGAFGDREAVVKFWRSVGYKTLPSDAEVQVFADTAIDDWEAVKAEV